MIGAAPGRPVQRDLRESWLAAAIDETGRGDKAPERRVTHMSQGRGR
jgi:hypothetical protein